MKSLMQCSLEINKHKNYLSVIKSSNKTLFRFLSIYGKGDLAAGYRYFLQYKRNIQNRIEIHFYSFENLTGLAQSLVDKGYYNYIQLPYGTLCKIVCSKELSLRQVKTAKKLLKRIENE